MEVVGLNPTLGTNEMLFSFTKNVIENKQNTMLNSTKLQRHYSMCMETQISLKGTGWDLNSNNAKYGPVYYLVM